jgi:HKD family nuclease
MERRLIILIHNNDLTFFTNEPERSLYDRFCSILNSNIQFFDVLVGYFRTSGFYMLYPAMEGVEKVRILVGINVDWKTIELINQSNDEVVIENLSHKEAKNIFSKSLESEFSTSDDTSDVERGTKVFIEWLKNNKLEIRMYPEEPIHAKVYIMRKDSTRVFDQYGSVITGSSNFSVAGLKNNLEFNVELKDSRDVRFALDRFEELWEKSVDISEIYIETVSKNTWIRDDIAPYELYLKTLYEYFKEEINQDKNETWEDMLPDGFMQLQYQIDAVVQARKILNAYNGVFISDVVGLGKTFICAMLAQKLKGRKLVICPPVLKEYWETTLQQFEVSAKVESLGKLDSIIENTDIMRNVKYVFIDEAHRFRNEKTDSFQKLHEICYNKKVILITATPQNNYSSDIASQIYLFQAKNNSTIIPNNKNLEAFFSRLDSRLKKIDKGSREYLETLKTNSEIIRDRVLRNIMIRRTRNEIMEYYKDDLEKQGLKFPELGIPEKIVYTFNGEIENVFNHTIRSIQNLTYARYKPLTYLQKVPKEVASLLVSQRNMSGFMKSILVKRLESSFEAFKKTLHRFILSYERFLNMCENGEVYISKKIDVYDLIDNSDDEKLMELIEADIVQHYPIGAFKNDFIPAIKYDLSLLRELEYGKIFKGKFFGENPNKCK